MFAIIDYRAYKETIDNLAKYANVINFKTDNITYEAIKGHPDIFFCKLPNKIIYSPSTPEKYIKTLINNNIQIEKGISLIQNKYPNNIAYNAVVTQKYIIHNIKYTDPIIKQNISKQTVINANQGYARCSIIPINENSFITSDAGIYKILKKISDIDTILVENNNIYIPNLNQGFIGGTAGIYNNKCFFTGNLKYHKQEKEIKEFILSKNFQIVELSNNPLMDCGSIIFT